MNEACPVRVTQSSSLDAISQLIRTVYASSKIVTFVLEQQRFRVWLYAHQIALRTNISGRKLCTDLPGTTSYGAPVYYSVVGNKLSGLSVSDNILRSENDFGVLEPMSFCVGTYLQWTVWRSTHQWNLFLWCIVILARHMFGLCIIGIGDRWTWKFCIIGNDRHLKQFIFMRWL